VRPTDFDRKPGAVSMEPDMARLYELIWKRAVASQMEAASLERTTVEIPSTDNKVVLRATGQVVKFDGFLTLYQEGKDESDDEEGRTPPRASSRAIFPSSTPPNTRNTSPNRRRASPKPRWSSASKNSVLAGRRPMPPRSPR
jgi:DNA topoisomerase-1